MSVINNKGFIDEGVTYLIVSEKFPVEIARTGFLSTIDVTLESITRVGESATFLLNYTLEHTITYRPVQWCDYKTMVKNYNITIPLELTTPPAVGTLPDITTTVTLDDVLTFINTCGSGTDAKFNKFQRGVVVEFEVATT
jgi:hypothetical protein